MLQSNTSRPVGGLEVLPSAYLSVCLFVCLSVRMSQKPHSTFHQTFCTLPAAVTWSSFNGSAICYVLPVLRMTSCFHMMERMGQSQRCLFRPVRLSLGGGIGGEVCHSAVSNCISLSTHND